MSPLNFRTKPSVPDSAQDLSDDAFIWASQNIGGRDAVEEFVSCGVWPLCASVDFEQVKVDLTPVSQLKVPLPHFPLRHENEEGDLQFMARVEQGIRNIVGGYTCMEHEACIASLLNNDCLNHVLKVVGVGYGPCPVPISTEVLKKRKADAAAKVLAKRPKLVEKKSVGLVKVSGSCGGRRFETAIRHGHPVGQGCEAEQGYHSPHSRFGSRDAHYAGEVHPEGLSRRQWC
jgi:hypothetical protein